MGDAGSNGNSNVILLPKTIDYYQIQLTRMLETERYAEAVKLLQFLLGCQTADERLMAEWRSLSDWLVTLAPAQPGPDSEDASAPAPDSEHDLLKEHVRSKTASDAGYTAHLLQMLADSPSMDKQMLALEQLAFAEGGQVSGTVEHWLSRSEHHPLVQFKALQVLKLRGVQGEVTIPRAGEVLKVEIERTPLAFSDFPGQFQRILSLIAKVSEVQDPTLHYYAEQTWNEFLAFVYGTDVYRYIERSGPEQLSRWAAALHTVLIEAVYQRTEEADIRRLYGLAEGKDAAWELALRFMRQFARAVFIRG